MVSNSSFPVFAGDRGGIGRIPSRTAASDAAIVTDIDIRRLYPFESRVLDRPAGRLHYLDEGSGEPVVMLHGNPTWGFHFRNLVRALRNKYRCVVPDHLGCGLSDKPDELTYEYSLKSRIDDIEALLRT